MVSRRQLALGLALWSVAIHQVWGDDPSLPAKAKVEYRWLEGTPLAGVTAEKGIRVSESGGLAYPHQKPVLTNDDVVEVRVTTTEFNMVPHYTLHFHLTKEARARLAATCGESGDKMLAGFIDGVPYGAPYYLKSRDQNNFVPYAGFISSKAEMERIVAAFKKTKPATHK